MSERDDLVKRLRAYAKDQGGWHNIDDTCEEAAERIEALEAEAQRLREALKPFAFAANELAGHEDSKPVIVSDHEKFTMTCVNAYDLRRARAAMEPTDE